jgi:hypothetical protein
MQSDGTDKVSVYWQNTPNNEQNYILSRSVNGGTYQPLTQIGADTTSYTDTNIPYNSAGDAEVQYEVVAVGQPDSSPPDPPANTGDGPTTAPTSAPAISANVDAEKVSIDRVYFEYGGFMTSGDRKLVAENGFSFSNTIQVVGTNVDQTEAVQEIDASTWVTQFGGTATPDSEIDSFFREPKNSPMANSNGWVPDLMKNDKGEIHQSTFTPVFAYSPDKTQGLAIKDWHNLPVPLLQAGNLPGRTFSYMCGTKQDFEITIKLKERMGKVLKTFNWGYSWSNGSYAWRDTDNPPAPVKVCASPQQPAGLGAGTITGYGDGTNNFTGFTYVDDINNPPPPPQ